MSRIGTVAISDVGVGSTREVVTVVSIYGAWERSAKDTGSRLIYADASVHRMISNLSALIARPASNLTAVSPTA